MFCYMLSAAQAILRQQALLESAGQPTLPEARLVPVVGNVALQDSLRMSTESKELEPEDDVSVDDDEPAVRASRVDDEAEPEGVNEGVKPPKAAPDDKHPRPVEPQEETEDDPHNCDPHSNKWRGAEKDLKFSIEKILSPAFGNDFWAQFPFYRPEMDFLQLQSLAGNLQRLQQLHAAANVATAQGTAHASHVAAAAAAGHGGHLQAMQNLATLQSCLKASMQQPPHALNGALNALHHVQATTGRQPETTPPVSALNNLQLSALQSMQQLQSLQLMQGRKSPESRKRRRSSDETSPVRSPDVTLPQSGASVAATTRLERHEDSESQDTVADSDSRLKASEEASGSAEEGAGSDKKSLWPAWVYCTRYSDRPSSGPRSKRTKRKEKSDEKRPRTAFTAEQLQRLKKEFQENKYLTEKRRQDLASELGLNESQIKIWFQNKRAKLKKSSGRPNPLALELMAQAQKDGTQ